MLLSCLLLDLSDTVLPGKLVALMAATDRKAALRDAWPTLVMVGFMLVLRRALLLFDSLRPCGSTSRVASWRRRYRIPVQ